MLKYEALLLAVPEITQDELRTIEGQFDSLIQGVKGNVTNFEKWGKYKLCFPVKKNEYGVYVLIRFDVPKNTSILDDIKSHFAIKLNDVVMRNVITVLDPKKPNEYQRPKSLEEMPAAQDVGTFLKENKMEGLLSSVDSSEQREKSEDFGQNEDSDSEIES